MRSGPIIHGALLILALLFAYQTATRTKDTKPSRGEHQVWKMSKVVSIHWESETKTLKVESRSDKQGPYLWGREDRTRKLPPAPSAPPPAPEHEGMPQPEALPEALTEPAPDEFETTTREFPIGVAGDSLFDDYQNLMALRSLGPLSPEQREEYGLHEDTINLTVMGEGDEKHTLLLASKSIYGGTDRYALDVDSDIGFVLSGKLVQPLDSAENSLGIKKKHLYEDKEVRSVEVKTTAGDKLIVKGTVTDEKGEHTIWSDATKPGENDQTLATFIDRVEKLRPSQYHPSLVAAELVHVATLRYLGQDKKPKGYLEIYRQLPEMQEADADPEAPEKVTEYFIKTERTRVLGKVSRLSAERVDQDLVTLFGIAPPPDPPAPKKKKAPPAPTPPALPVPGAAPAGALPPLPGSAAPKTAPAPKAAPAPKTPAAKPAAPAAKPGPRPTPGAP